MGTGDFCSNLQQVSKELSIINPIQVGCVFGYAFGYACCRDLVTRIWLRFFGYDYLVLVTFWLRKHRFWLRFGYALTRPGKNLVTHDLVTFWLRFKRIVREGCQNRLLAAFLVTLTTPQRNAA